MPDDPQIELERRRLQLEEWRAQSAAALSQYQAQVVAAQGGGAIQLDRFRAVSTSAVEGFKASANAQVAWLGAVAEFALKQAQTLHEQIRAEADDDKRRLWAVAASQCEREYHEIERRRYKAELRAKRHEAFARDFARLFYGPDISDVSTIAGWSAYRYFIREEPGAAGRLLGQPSCCEGETVGQLAERLRTGRTAPEVGTPEWTTLAGLVAGFVEESAKTIDACSAAMEKLNQSAYATWNPLKVLELAEVKQ